MKGSCTLLKSEIEKEFLKIDKTKTDWTKKNFSKAAKKYKFQGGGPAGGECEGESVKKKEKKVCSDNLKALLQEKGKRNPDAEKVKSLRNKSGSKINLKKKEEEGTLFSEEDFEKFASSYFIKSK